MENYRTNLKLKMVRSTRLIRQAKIACCQHYACFEKAKQMMKKAIQNGYASVTMNVQLAEAEYNKFCELAGNVGLNVDIKEQNKELNVVTQIDVFVDLND